jgi:hypothetical protein
MPQLTGWFDVASAPGAAVAAVAASTLPSRLRGVPSFRVEATRPGRVEAGDETWGDR